MASLLRVALLLGPSGCLPASHMSGCYLPSTDTHLTGGGERQPPSFGGTPSSVSDNQETQSGGGLGSVEWGVLRWTIPPAPQARRSPSGQDAGGAVCWRPSHVPPPAPICPGGHLPLSLTFLGSCSLGGLCPLGSRAPA